VTVAAESTVRRLAHAGPQATQRNSMGLSSVL
jgi:hypothetical protein